MCSLSKKDEVDGDNNAKCGMSPYRASRDSLSSSGDSDVLLDFDMKKKIVDFTHIHLLAAEQQPPSVITATENLNTEFSYVFIQDPCFHKTPHSLVLPASLPEPSSRFLWLL